MKGLSFVETWDKALKAPHRRLTSGPAIARDVPCNLSIRQLVCLSVLRRAYVNANPRV